MKQFQERQQDIFMFSGIILIILLSILFVLITTCSAGVMQPKTGNSVSMPEIIVLSNGMYQCRYNVKPYKKKDMDGNIQTGYTYDYIELKSISENTITDALIENNQECDQAEVIKSIVSEKDRILKNDAKEIKEIVIKDRLVNEIIY